MPESSIVIKATDKYSYQIKSMASETKRFSKDVDGLEDKLRYLDKEQDRLSNSITKTKKTIRELQQEFDKTGDAAVGLKLETERFNLHTMTRELDVARKEVRETEREIRNMSDTTKRAGQLGGGGFSDVMKAFAASGLTQMAGELVQSLASSKFTSAFGSDAGTVFSSALSSAASGAAIGTALLGPGIGTAVGAAAGGAIGAGTGWLQTEQNKDEYFKSYYNGIIDEQAQQRASDLETGSSIAAGRERDLISFTTLFGGNQKTAERYLENLVDMANTTPFLYDDLTAMSKTLATYKYSDREILPVLTKIGDAGAALGMGTSDMTMVATALGRMKSSDKATLEYLNILNDRGIGAVGMLAEAKGMSVGDTYTAISKGEIKGGEAVEIILAALERSYAGSMAEQSKTFSGLTSTLEGMKQEMQNAYGQGYNEERSLGVQAEINALSGPMGEAEKALNEHKGALAAYRENLQEQYTREAKSAVMTGAGLSKIWDRDSAKQLNSMNAEYLMLKQKADAGDKEAVLQMANLEDQAEALAKAAYDNSDWASKELTAEQDNTKAIRELTARLDDGIMLKYQVEQEGTKGRVIFGGDSSGIVKSQASGYLSGRVSAPAQSSYAAGLQAGFGGKPHAAGLNRVPYDGYAAILHEGERVLTAREARSADRGGGDGSVVVNVSGNTFEVRQESDIDAIAQAIAEEIRRGRQKGTF